MPFAAKTKTTTTKQWKGLTNAHDLLHPPPIIPIMAVPLPTRLNSPQPSENHVPRQRGNQPDTEHVKYRSLACLHPALVFLPPLLLLRLLLFIVGGRVGGGGGVGGIPPDETEGCAP